MTKPIAEDPNALPPASAIPDFPSLAAVLGFSTEILTALLSEQGRLQIITDYPRHEAANTLLVYMTHYMGRRIEIQETRYLLHGPNAWRVQARVPELVIDGQLRHQPAFYPGLHPHPTPSTAIRSAARQANTLSQG